MGIYWTEGDLVFLWTLLERIFAKSQEKALKWCKSGFNEMTIIVFGSILRLVQRRLKL